MRFAATHKVVSYLMVTTAFLMLALTGELPALLVLLTACGIAGSFFFDPQAHPFMQGRTYRYLWYAVLCGLSLWLLPDPSHGESIWDSGTRLLCLFLVAKLWQRRGNGDYLQAYVISFLMLLAASLLGSSVLFAVCLLLYVTFSTWKVRHGLWLEDLFVLPEHRRSGLGRQLLARLAQICVERGWPRFEWWVLDWNEPAHAFYRSIGAVPQDGDAVRHIGDLRDLVGDDDGGHALFFEIGGRVGHGVVKEKGKKIIVKIVMR